MTSLDGEWYGNTAAKHGQPNDTEYTDDSLLVGEDCADTKKEEK